jgi:hypothetical protein
MLKLMLLVCDSVHIYCFSLQSKRPQLLLPTTAWLLLTLQLDAPTHKITLSQIT